MNRLLKQALNFFFKGILVIVPIIVSFYVIYYVISSVDSIVNLGFPGAGILLAVGVLTLTGFLVTTFITEPIFNYFDKVLDRMPLFKLLYSSIRDLLEAFVGEDKKFNEPVTVETGDGIKQIGFLTQKDLSNIGLATDVAVYFPFSYSIAGRVVFVARDKVKPLNMKAGDAMKFIVSGGVSDLHQADGHR